LRLAPTLDWIEAALPQQNAKLLDGMDTAVEVRVTGVSGRTLRIGNGDMAAQIASDQQHSYVGSPNVAAGKLWASMRTATRLRSMSSAV
jgi:hypothetical protein